MIRFVDVPFVSVQVEKQQRLQIQTRLCSLSLSDECVDQLCNFVFHEGEFRQLVSQLRPITNKTKGQAGSLAKKGLYELEALISHIEALGCKFPVILAIGLLSNIQHCSGILFQVVYDRKHNNRTTIDVLAAGGRYDRLLTRFRKPGTTPAQPNQGCVGVSIAYDKIVSAATEKGSTLPVPVLTDALICSLGYRSSTKELLFIAKELWAIGVCADVYLEGSQSLEEIKDYCRENHINHLIVQESEISLIKLLSSERDRVVKKDIVMHELTEYFQSLLRNRSLKFSDVLDASLTKSSLSSSLASNYTGDSSSSLYGSSNIGGGGGNTGSGGGSTGGSSGSGVGGFGSSANALPPYNISFILQDNNKLAKNTKRSYESQAVANVTPSLARLNNRCRVEVLGLELSVCVIKSLAVHLDFSNDEGTLLASISTTIKEYPRYKKYLVKIVNEISDLKFENNKQSPIVILYSLVDDTHRVLF